MQFWQSNQWMESVEIISFLGRQITLLEVSTSFHNNIVFLVWDLKQQKLTKKIDVTRPQENELFKYRDNNIEIVNYAPEHVLNTPGALQR